MIQKGEYGFVIELDLGEEIDGVTTARILYKKPSGTTGYWTATYANGYVRYTVFPNDINEAGYWTVQAYVAGSGFAYYGDPATFYVDEPVS